MEIRNLLEGVKNLEMVVPEFQREYVWTLEQAKQLLVSLFKDYPTGCLLFWETMDPPEIKNNALKIEKIGWTKVILDGQQRLTTLYFFLKGEIPPYYVQEEILNDPRHLYFNLETGEFQYYKKIIMQNNPLWRKVIDCFANNLNAFNIINKELMIDPSQENYISLGEKINENINKLKDIEKKDYPILTIPSTAKIDEAIDVFDRVNSLGTKLTDAELVLTHITGKWPQARKVMKEMISSFALLNFKFDLDFLTRCIVVALTKSALYESVKYENMEKEDYVQAWQKVRKAFDLLVPVLRQEAFINGTNDLQTLNVLVPLIAHLIKNNFKFTNEKKNRLLYWMYLALIWSRYSGQTDQKIDKDVQIIMNSNFPVDELVNEIIDQRGRIVVKASDLEGKGAGHPLYKMLYIITKYKKAIDWANGGSIAETLGDYYSIQSHHIFPQSVLYNNGFDSENHIDKKQVNEIANRAFITRDANFEISSKPPSEYLPEVNSKYPNALEKQLIPLDIDLWKVENYKMFLEKRRNLISKDIMNFLNLLNTDSQNRKMKINWLEIIKKGENNYTEFKSCLRFDLREKKVMPHIEHSILKSICSMLNSEGGKLFIGISDEMEILGLEKDLSTFKNKNKDEFLLHFDNMIKNYLGKEFFQYLSPEFVVINEKEVFILDISPSFAPVFLKHQGKEEFYIRAAASSQLMSQKETLDYVRLKWS